MPTDLGRKCHSQRGSTDSTIKSLSKVGAGENLKGVELVVLYSITEHTISTTAVKASTLEPQSKELSIRRRLESNNGTRPCKLIPPCSMALSAEYRSN